MQLARTRSCDMLCAFLAACFSGLFSTRFTMFLRLWGFPDARDVSAGFDALGLLLASVSCALFIGFLCYSVALKVQWVDAVLSTFLHAYQSKVHRCISGDVCAFISVSVQVQRSAARAVAVSSCWSSRSVDQRQLLLPTFCMVSRGSISLVECGCLPRRADATESSVRLGLGVSLWRRACAHLVSGDLRMQHADGGGMMAGGLVHALQATHLRSCPHQSRRSLFMGRACIAICRSN